eukprot:176275-Hanusia_phi.AAC.1
MLLNRQADPLARDDQGNTCLHVAAATRGMEEVLRKMLEKHRKRAGGGGERNAAGLSVMHVACLAGHLEAVALLCEVDPQSAHVLTPPPAGEGDTGSESAMHLCLGAEEATALRMMKLLLSKRCNPFAEREPDKKTVAMLAQASAVLGGGE